MQGDNLLNEIRAHFPVSHVVGQWVALKKRGREYIGLSPFKKEKTPSFTVNDDKGFYHCFSTGEHGDIFSFIMKMEGLTFPEAVERLAIQAGISLCKNVKKDFSHSKIDYCYSVLETAKKIFIHLMNQKIRDYFFERGIFKESIDFFFLGFCDSRLKEHMIQHPMHVLEQVGLFRNGRVFFANRIIFPVHDDTGRVVGFGGRKITNNDFGGKYINSPDTFLFHKGSLLYNFFRAKNYRNDTLIIVEGYIDVIILHQYGFPCAVAPLGTNLTEKQILLAWRIFHAPCICFDGDKSGVQAAYRIASKILSILTIGKTVNFIFLPKGEDPDSFLRKEGSDSFRNLLKTKKTLLDVIWLSLKTNSCHTPDEKAILEKEIEKICQLIKDPLIRKHYKFSLKECLWKEILSKKNTPVVYHFDLELKQQQVILATLYNHPCLVSDFLEELTYIEWRDVLKPLVNQLLQNGYIDYTPDFLSHEIYQLASQAHPSAKKEDVRIFLKHVFALHQRSLSFK